MANEMVPKQPHPGGDNPPLSESLERAIAKGDFSQVSPDDRLRYLNVLCGQLGLNPLTMPFTFLAARNGAVSLYCTKGGGEQLRKIHNVSLEIVSEETRNGLYTVRVRATMRTAQQSPRTDEDLAAVPVEGVKGEELARLMKKCVSQAKRRVTLSIVGAGFSDEEDGPPAAPARTTQEEVPAMCEPRRLPATQHELASAIQLAEITRLKHALAVDPAVWLKVLGKRGVNEVRLLTREQAGELINGMAAKLEAEERKAQDAAVAVAVTRTSTEGDNGARSTANGRAF